MTSPSPEQLAPRAERLQKLFRHARLITGKFPWAIRCQVIVLCPVCNHELTPATGTTTYLAPRRVERWVMFGCVRTPYDAARPCGWRLTVTFDVEGRS